MDSAAVAARVAATASPRLATASSALSWNQLCLALPGRMENKINRIITTCISRTNDAIAQTIIITVRRFRMSFSERVRTWLKSRAASPCTGLEAGVRPRSKKR